MAQAETIEDMARAVATRPESPPGVIAFRERGAKPSLFCIPPVTGNPLCYLELARHLDSARGVFGLEAPGLSRGAPTFDTVEQLAGDYITSMRTVQSSGPYLLLGWSAGAIVAYEIARQLRLAGEEIELLALLDSEEPQSHLREGMSEEINPAARWVLDDTTAAYLLVRNIARTRGKTLNADRSDFEGLSAGALVDRVISLFDSVDINFLTPEMALRVLTVFRRVLHAVATYPGRSSDLRVKLISAAWFLGIYN
jgi:hypothetical protein